MVIADQLTVERGVTRIALVNNMPDAAFVDTEDQFQRAINAGSGDEVVKLDLYAIAEVQRSAATTAVIQERYGGLDQLFANPPDGLIITGTEPTHAKLSSEPYWGSLARLLNWAAETVPTTLLSCLAAHASVFLFDGIERQPRKLKASGVYTGFITDPGAALVRGAPEVVRIPHSRLNDIPEATLLEAGYRIVIGSGSDRNGWSLATRRCGDSFFVLCQGHPEYGTLSLLREYRRDVRRYLLGQDSQPYPRLPEGYLSAEAGEVCLAFAERARAAHADPRELWAAFPYEQIAAGVENTWAETAATVYRNWIREARLAHAVGRGTAG